MLRSWYLDPAIILERADNRRSCPACINNDFTKEKNGFKHWYCRLGKDQNGGTQTAETCKYWYRKGKRAS